MIDIVELQTLVKIQHLKIKPQSSVFPVVRRIEANHIYSICKFVYLHPEIVLSYLKVQKSTLNKFNIGTRHIDSVIINNYHKNIMIT